MKKIVIPILILASIILALASQTSQEEPTQIKQTSDLSLESEIKKSYPKPEYDTRLDIDPRAKEWYDISDFDEAGASNIGALYYKNIKDYEKAEFWFKKALSINQGKVTLFNLALLYETIKR